MSNKKGMKHICVFVVALSILGSCSRKIIPEPSIFTTINLSTHILATYSISKNTKYLIVFESGLGDIHSIWNQKNLPTAISAQQDVLLYDRAGYGKSGKGPGPRNIMMLSSDLDSVITKFSNRRKVILVGHSLGGMIIRDYAVKNPQKIAGLLFIDPSHENYNRPTQTQQNLIKLLVGIKSKGAKMEAQELIEDANYMATIKNLPNIPVIVLTSMKQDETNTKSDNAYNKSRQDWYNNHELLKNGVTDFTHISTVKSGHYIFLEEPSLVLDNLKLLISKLP